ncbi:MAG TPA: hypothetical protein VFO10_17495 [Oligoflexus sp.]|uniref:hypothetical protein n=1 Tax=Oligoflexus sp. TaxID=1971216 RepID=UPI002D8022B0|nr:hypothetical protein [Oligoflexus sp.]HET9239057.1 hypothetical protein [Oligoflexus sp.]
MKRFFTALALFFASGAQSQSLQTFPHVEGAPYFYFLCNATSWSLNEESRLSCDDAQCISYFLDYDVKENWMVSEHDRCMLLRTTELDQWNGSSEVLGAYVERPDEPAKINFMQVPAVARFFGHDAIQVKYPGTGRYRIWVTRARAAFSVQALPTE